MTFYADELGWVVGVNGWQWIAGSLDYCLKVLADIAAALAVAVREGR